MLSVSGVIALAFYLSSLVVFGFVTHPLGYCLLLVVGAVSLSAATIIFFGFSWYLALFILVYVGGIYVLFLFVSVHSANSLPVLGVFPSFVFLVFFFFFMMFSWLFDCTSFIEDESRFLCSSVEGTSYLVLCFTLLVGFVGVSVVSGQKDSFFR